MSGYSTSVMLFGNVYYVLLEELPAPKQALTLSAQFTVDIGLGS